MNEHVVSILLNRNNSFPDITNLQLLDAISNQRSGLNLEKLKKLLDMKKANPLSVSYLLHGTLYKDLSLRRLLFDTYPVSEYLTDYYQIKLTDSYSLLSCKYKGVNLFSLKSVDRSYMNYVKVKTSETEYIPVHISDPEIISVKKEYKRNNDDIDGLVNEMIVGLYCTNIIRRTSPNFLFLIGGFRNGTYVSRDESDQKLIGFPDSELNKVTYMNHELPLNYVVYELIDKDPILSDIINFMTGDEFHNIVAQLYLALLDAQAFGFTHYNLTCDSVIIRDLPASFNIQYHRGLLTVNRLAMMFNFTESFFLLNGRPMTNLKHPNRGTNMRYDLVTFFESCIELTKNKNSEIYSLAEHMLREPNLLRFLLRPARKVPLLRSVDNTIEIFQEVGLSRGVNINNVTDYQFVKNKFNYKPDSMRLLKLVSDTLNMIESDLSTLNIKSISKIPVDSLYTTEVLVPVMESYSNVGKIDFSLRTCQMKVNDLRVIATDFQDLELNKSVAKLDQKVKSLRELLNHDINILNENSSYLDQVDNKRHEYPWSWYWNDRRKYFHE